MVVGPHIFAVRRAACDSSGVGVVVFGCGCHRCFFLAGWGFPSAQGFVGCHDRELLQWGFVRLVVKIYTGFGVKSACHRDREAADGEGVGDEVIRTFGVV